MWGHYPSVINPEANFKTFKIFIDGLYLQCGLCQGQLFHPFFTVLYSLHFKPCCAYASKQVGSEEKGSIMLRVMTRQHPLDSLLPKSLNYKWRLLFCFPAALTQMLTQKLYSL